MAAIFVPHVRDDDETTIYFRVMTKHGHFWYHYATCSTLAEAQELLDDQSLPILIERVTHELIERRNDGTRNER